MRHFSSFSKGYICRGKQNQRGSLEKKCQADRPPAKGTENQRGARLSKTMSLRLMTLSEGGNKQKGGKLCQLVRRKTAVEQKTKWSNALPSRI